MSPLPCFTGEECCFQGQEVGQSASSQKTGHPASIDRFEAALIAFMGTVSTPLLAEATGHFLRSGFEFVKEVLQSSSHRAHFYVPVFGNCAASNTYLGCEAHGGISYLKVLRALTTKGGIRTISALEEEDKIKMLWISIMQARVYFDHPRLPEWIQSGADTRVTLEERPTHQPTLISRPISDDRRVRRRQ
ncbi:hypothetical protein OC861_004670 [Tilletia horrida]|nr:hypothetical protein OC861_004670 [Tilletia horrida]